MNEMGALGFIAPELPEEFGGLGLGSLAAGVIHEEIARADLSMSYVNLLASLNGQILAQHGAPEVVKPWLARLTAGEALLAIALTEPRGGSDAANLRLRIERDGDHYVVNGEKTSISAADQADAAVVFGRTGSVESGAHGVTALFVPMDLPGVTRNRFDCHGQRAIGRGSLFFDNVRVPVSHRLGDENKGFVQVMQGFDFSRALIGLQVLAVARVALEETWAYVAQRQAFGKPLSAFQGVSHPLADFDTQVEAARLLCLQALWLKDKGAPHSAEAAMCKWWAPKLAYDDHPPMPAHARPRRLRPRAHGAAAARRAGLRDRRRHGPDHEDHHRARSGRARGGAGVRRPTKKPTTGEETWNSTPYSWRRAAPKAWRAAIGATARSTTISTPASLIAPTSSR